jgi:hypothetical protein
MLAKVGFSTSDWFVSRDIREVTRANVSHVFFLLEGTELGDLVLEAAWCGWRLSTKAALTRGSTRVISTITPKQDVTKAVLQSLAWLDEKYNYEGIVGMLVVSIGRWLGKKWRNPLRNSNSLFCSEAVAYVLKLAEYPGADALDPQSVSPEDILEFLQQ